MVYLIVDSEKPDKVTLVKAECQDDVKALLNLKATQKFVGSLTRAEISTLDTASVVVLMA